MIIWRKFPREPSWPLALLLCHCQTDKKLPRHLLDRRGESLIAFADVNHIIMERCAHVWNFEKENLRDFRRFAFDLNLLIYYIRPFDESNKKKSLCLSIALYVLLLRLYRCLFSKEKCAHQVKCPFLIPKFKIRIWCWHLFYAQLYAPTISHIVRVASIILLRYLCLSRYHLD